MAAGDRDRLFLTLSPLPENMNAWGGDRLHARATIPCDRTGPSLECRIAIISHTIRCHQIQHSRCVRRHYRAGPWLGVSPPALNAVMTELSSRFRVIFIDLAGHCESAAATGPYTIQRFAADVAATAAGSVSLVGHSMGALICIEAARLLPGRITRVVALDALAHKRIYPAQYKSVLLLYRIGLACLYRPMAWAITAASFVESDDPDLRTRIMADMRAGAPKVGRAVGCGECPRRCPAPDGGVEANYRVAARDPGGAVDRSCDCCPGGWIRVASSAVLGVWIWFMLERPRILSWRTGLCDLNKSTLCKAMTTLENARYLEVTKGYVGHKPRNLARPQLRRPNRLSRSPRRPDHPHQQRPADHV